MLRRVHQHAVICVCLDMLLEILGALEGLAAKVALVRLEGNVYADVGGDVVALDGGGATGAPLAGEVQVVGALAANMALTDVILGRGSVAAAEDDARGRGGELT